MNRLVDKIKNKIVCIVLHGKSIEELENRIEEFNNDNICWVSMNTFDIVQNNILNKINKQLDIIYHFSLHRGNIEIEVQIPNLKQAIDKGSLLITNKNLFIDAYTRLQQEEFINEYKDKVLLLDDIKTKANIPLEKVEAGLPTICYILYSLIIMGASKIIVFGFDGSDYDINTSDMNSYYKSDIVFSRTVLPKEKVENLAKGFLGSIGYDTLSINNNFLAIYEKIKSSFNLSELPIILNCSPISKIKVFKIIDYNEALEECERTYNV